MGAAEDVLWGGGAGGGRGEAASRQNCSLSLAIAFRDRALRHGSVPASCGVAME